MMCAKPIRLQPELHAGTLGLGVSLVQGGEVFAQAQTKAVSPNFTIENSVALPRLPVGRAHGGETSRALGLFQTPPALARCPSLS
jgi:hypothetical protein